VRGSPWRQLRARRPWTAPLAPMGIRGQGNTLSFVRMVAEAARIACIPDYLLLRPVLVELKRRYPEDSQPGRGDAAVK